MVNMHKLDQARPSSIKLVSLSSQILRSSSSTRQPTRVARARLDNNRVDFKSIPSSSRVGLTQLHPYI